MAKKLEARGGVEILKEARRQAKIANMISAVSEKPSGVDVSLATSGTLPTV
jgi:hypothetical protein